MINKEESNMIIERQVHTYAEIRHAAQCLLQMGRSQPEGNYFQFMSSLVFSAFTLEAYLNHIGNKLFDCWEKI
jgi:hypothetical protein